MFDFLKKKTYICIVNQKTTVCDANIVNNNGSVVQR